jgi:hypothetical protein
MVVLLFRLSQAVAGSRVIVGTVVNPHAEKTGRPRFPPARWSSGSLTLIPLSDQLLDRARQSRLEDATRPLMPPPHRREPLGTRRAIGELRAATVRGFYGVGPGEPMDLR